MPSLITHHIFGEDAAQRLPEGLIDGEEELLAFLLGNEGPDPFFARFRAIPARASACRHLARDMHASHVAKAFGDIRSSVGHLPVEDERIGRAFSLGLLGHYVLDRTAHPLIFAQQFALLEQPGLSDASREIHAMIESDIDSWILWEKRHVTVLEHHPASDLMRTTRIERVGGVIFSQVALAVFGLNVGPEEYGGAVSDYQWLYRVIEPAGSAKTRLIGMVERLARPHSMAESFSHRAAEPDGCASANLERREWANPFTGKRSRASFADLFEEALVTYPRMAEAFVRADRERFDAMVGGINYDGRPVGDR